MARRRVKKEHGAFEKYCPLNSKAMMLKLSTTTTTATTITTTTAAATVLFHCLYFQLVSTIYPALLSYSFSLVWEIFYRKPLENLQIQEKRKIKFSPAFLPDNNDVYINYHILCFSGEDGTPLNWFLILK